VEHGDPGDQGLTLVTFAYILEHRDRLLAVGAPLFRLGNQGGGIQATAVSLEAILALDPDEQVKADFALPRRWVDRPPFPAALGLDAPPDHGFPSRWVGLLDLSPRERIRELIKQREHFETQRKDVSDLGDRATLVMEVSEAVFAVNRASLSLDKDELTVEDHQLVKETQGVIRSVVEMMAEPELARVLFGLLRTPSLDTTFRHVLRVFSSMVGFLLFFQDQHARGMSHRIRVAFPERYRGVYRRLLPAVSDASLTSDNVVRLSTLSIPQIRVYALGALLHDIGKVFDLDHRVATETLGRYRVEQHPILGSGLFLRTYGHEHEEARYIIGDHQNHLFHPEGYGLTRWERKNGRRVFPSYQCCLTDSLSDFTAGQALGFFPAEACALIGLYDGLTTPDDGPGVSVGAALERLRDDALVHGKVDPILFDLFTDYLRSMGTEVP